jgi:hypothetical protein
MTAPTSDGGSGDGLPRSGPGPTLTNTRDRLRFYKKSDYNDMKDILSLFFRTRNAQLIHKLLLQKETNKINNQS